MSGVLVIVILDSSVSLVSAPVLLLGRALGQSTQLLLRDVLSAEIPGGLQPCLY